MKLYITILFIYKPQILNENQLMLYINEKKDQQWTQGVSLSKFNQLFNNIIIGNDCFRYPFQHLEQNWTFEQNEVLDTAFYVTNYGDSNV